MFTTKAKPKGYILERFLSPIDGQSCVAILTLNSANRKTGDMAQVWILREDVNPVAAIASGDDYSICGHCPHRVDIETGNRSCYVNIGQAPLAVWKAYKAGKYAEDFLYQDGVKLLKNKTIRWGAYGDPAIINPQIFNAINSLAKGHTGYTHQWRESWAQNYKQSFMASVDSFADYLEASAHGWRCFSVTPPGKVGQGKQCPATVENSKSECKTCLLCDGAKIDVFVEAHGRGKKYVTTY